MEEAGLREGCLAVLANVSTDSQVPIAPSLPPVLLVRAVTELIVWTTVVDIRVAVRQVKQD